LIRLTGRIGGLVVLTGPRLSGLLLGGLVRGCLLRIHRAGLRRAGGLRNGGSPLLIHPAARLALARLLGHSIDHEVQSISGQPSTLPRTPAGQDAYQRHHTGPYDLAGSVRSHRNDVRRGTHEHDR